MTQTETETTTETETVTETVPATAAERAELDQRAARLKDREKSVAERERKVRRQERIIARSRFGDGTYLVGKDIPAGSYLAPRAGGDCYWERRRPGASGLDAIIENYIGAGQARVTVFRGELFQTQRCGTWRRG